MILSEGFPCVTTKKLHLKSIIHELLWFLKGDTNINTLKIMESEFGMNGQIKWRFRSCLWLSMEKLACSRWKHIDQIKQVVDSLKNNPDSRRIIVSAWNVGEIEQMALPPCHAFFQFYVADGKLSCQLYQRSADIFLGCTI